MEERIDNETVQQIDLISMLKDIGREWMTILLLAIAAALFADIWICATYQPEYRTSTTFVVTAKGMNNNIYQNLNSTKELASQFTEILGSNVLKKKSCPGSWNEQPECGDFCRSCAGDESDHTFC